MNRELGNLVKHYLPPRRTMRCPPEKRRPTTRGSRGGWLSPATDGVSFEQTSKGSLGWSGGEGDEEVLDERNCGLSFDPRSEDTDTLGSIGSSKRGYLPYVFYQKGSLLGFHK